MTQEHKELLLRILQNEWRIYIQWKNEVQRHPKKKDAMWERDYALRQAKLEYEKCRHEGVSDKEILRLLGDRAKILLP